MWIVFFGILVDEQIRIQMWHFYGMSVWLYTLLCVDICLYYYRGDEISILFLFVYCYMSSSSVLPNDYEIRKCLPAQTIYDAIDQFAHVSRYIFLDIHI